LTRYAGIFLIHWIPACAGMTRFRSNEQSEFKVKQINHRFGMKKDDAGKLGARVCLLRKAIQGGAVHYHHIGF